MTTRRVAAWTCVGLVVLAQAGPDATHAVAAGDRAPAVRAQHDSLRAAYSARYLMGLPVRAANGEHVGTIDDLVIDRRTGLVALSVKTPERTRILVPWARTRVDAQRNSVYAAIETPQARATFARVRLDASAASGELTVCVAPLLRSKADLGGIAHVAPIDDVIVSRDGYAVALVTGGGDAADGLTHHAYRFPLRFAYDAARRELVMPSAKRLQSAAFDYGELGIIPPRERRTRASGEAAANPLPVALPPALSRDADGCWARLYSAPAFRGNPLTLVGPLAVTRLKEKIGFPWDPAYESIMVGPDATLDLYAEPDYHDRAARFKAGERIADLDRSMGRFRLVRSAALTCDTRD